MRGLQGVRRGAGADPHRGTLRVGALRWELQIRDVVRKGLHRAGFVTSTFQTKEGGNGKYGVQYE